MAFATCSCVKLLLRRAVRSSVRSRRLSFRGLASFSTSDPSPVNRWVSLW